MKKSFFLTAFLCRTDGACVLAISWDPGCSDDEIESASMAACCQEIFLISREIFKEKQDIKNEAREISNIVS